MFNSKKELEIKNRESKLEALLTLIKLRESYNIISLVDDDSVIGSAIKTKTIQLISEL